MSKANVVIRPVEVNAAGEPLDPALWVQYAAFCEREFGAPIVPSKTFKTWASLVLREDGGYEECVGVLVLQWQLVCPTFHLKKISTREEVPIIHASRDGLINRAKSYVQDNGGGGSNIHVYCAPEAREMWKGFLDSLKAVQANLWTVAV